MYMCFNAGLEGTKRKNTRYGVDKTKAGTNIIHTDRNSRALSNL